MKKIAANLNATVIIQHDLRDIGKLPAFRLQRSSRVSGTRRLRVAF